MKKNTKSPMEKEQTAKRIAKARRPVQREPKEVLAELVEKLRGKLELTSGENMATSDTSLTLPSAFRQQS